MKILKDNENSFFVGREDCVLGFFGRMFRNLDVNVSVFLKLMLVERWEGSRLGRGRC